MKILTETHTHAVMNQSPHPYNRGHDDQDRRTKRDVSGPKIDGIQSNSTSLRSVRLAPRGNRLRVHQDVEIIDIMVRVLHVTNLMERTVHHNRSFAEMMKSELKRTR
jgi:hypothetical protein